MSKTNKAEQRPVPNPEVSDRPKRRKFTGEYKLRILRELDACAEPGQKGAILRREGLYSSHVSDWRRARALGELQGLRAKKTGRPRKKRNVLQPEVEHLQRENARLQEELRKTRLIIDVQKKVAAMLDNPSDEPTGSGD